MAIFEWFEKVQGWSAVAWGVSLMDDVLVLSILTAVLCCIMVWLLVSGRWNIDITAEEMHERLDVMEKSLQIVATVLNELPNLVPKFELHNSPISQILEFLQSLKGEEPSYEGASLRQPTGMFASGDESTEGSGSEEAPE